jgi:hypothetical protein
VPGLLEPSWRRDYPKTLPNPCCCWKQDRIIPILLRCRKMCVTRAGLVARPTNGDIRLRPYRAGPYHCLYVWTVGGWHRSNQCRCGTMGHPADFAAWQARGLHDWGWSDVVPWFRRLETDHDATGTQHGRNGPIPIMRYRQ